MSGIEIQEHPDGPVIHGELIQFYSPLNNTNTCAGVVCSEEELCSKGCSGNEWPVEMCVADQQFSCNLEQEYTNMKYYWSERFENGVTDNGVTMYLTYPKKNEHSGLRVAVEMTFRAFAYGKCGYMYFKFNGYKCSNPATIELVDEFQNSADQHRASDVDGTCYGIPEGDVLIEVFVGPCNGQPTSDLVTGWRAARTMTVTEVLPQNNRNAVGEEKPCPLSAVLNYQYYTWDEDISETFDTTVNDFLLKSIIYTKMASDTSLRIKYSGLMGVFIPQDGYSSCGRWFLAINGTECSPRADAIIYHEQERGYQYWSELLRVYSIEGICDNELVAGVYSIDIYIGECLNITTNQPTQFKSGGGLTPTRMHIEEVRLDHSVDAVATASSRVYKSVTGYMSRYYYYALNSAVDVGDILSVTYSKQFDDTSLKLTAIGSHMHRYPGGSGSCCRWYFVIDSAECTDPGVIEGVLYHVANARSHKPLLITGICNGVQKGDHNITYAVGHCFALGKGVSYTGMASAFNIFVEELRMESTATCSGAPEQPVNCGSA